MRELICLKEPRFFTVQALSPRTLHNPSGNLLEMMNMQSCKLCTESPSVWPGANPETFSARGDDINHTSSSLLPQVNVSTASVLAVVKNMCNDVEKHEKCVKCEEEEAKRQHVFWHYRTLLEFDPSSLSIQGIIYKIWNQGEKGKKQKKTNTRYNWGIS